MALLRRHWPETASQVPGPRSLPEKRACAGLVVRARSHSMRSAVPSRSMASSAGRVARVASSGEAEHVKHAALGGAILQVPQYIAKAHRCRAIARIEISRHHGAGPTANTGKNRDVFLAIRTAIGDGLANNAGARLELPQGDTAPFVDGLEQS